MFSRHFQNGRHFKLTKFLNCHNFVNIYHKSSNEVSKHTIIKFSIQWSACLVCKMDYIWKMWFINVNISLLNHEFSTYMQCDFQTR